MPSRHKAWAAAAAIAGAYLLTLAALPATAQSQTELERAYRTIASKTLQTRPVSGLGV
jgi:hypothetical protein